MLAFNLLPCVLLVASTNPTAFVAETNRPWGDHINAPEGEGGFKHKYMATSFNYITCISYPIHDTNHVAKNLSNVNRDTVRP